MSFDKTNACHVVRFSKSCHMKSSAEKWSKPSVSRAPISMKKTEIDGCVGILGDLLQANGLMVVEIVNQWVHET